MVKVEFIERQNDDGLCGDGLPVCRAACGRLEVRRHEQAMIVRIGGGFRNPTKAETECEVLSSARLLFLQPANLRERQTRHFRDLLDWPFDLQKVQCYFLNALFYSFLIDACLPNVAYL